MKNTKVLLTIICGLSLTLASCIVSTKAPEKTVAQAERVLAEAPDEEEIIASEHADKKNYFNLYETQWDFLKDIPVYDQSGFPACYSYASSQFTEYFLRKTNALIDGTEHISPVWTAFNYKNQVKGLVAKTIKKRKSSTLGYGQAGKSIVELQEHGVCSSKVIRQNLAKIIQDDRLDDADMVAMIEITWENRTKADRENIYSRVKSDWRIQRLMKNSNRPHREQNLNSSDLKKILTRIYDYIASKNIPEDENSFKTFITFFENDVLDGCAQASNIRKYEIPRTKSSGKMYASNKKIGRLIWKGFQKSNFEYPVVIGYCSNVFKVKDASHTVSKRSILPRVVQRNLEPSSKCSSHYSLVMGRRLNPETQKYDILVRNSYGNEYMPVSNGCFCRNNNTNQFEDCKGRGTSDIIPPKHLTVLGCWLNQDTVATTVYEVMRFKLDDQHLSDEVDLAVDVIQ